MGDSLKEKQKRAVVEQKIGFIVKTEFMYPDVASTKCSGTIDWIA